MRRHDNRVSARCKQTMNFFHGAHDVSDVLDHMDSAHFAKRAITERKREAIQIRDDIGARVGISIYPDRARIFVEAAADV